MNEDLNYSESSCKVVIDRKAASLIRGLGRMNKNQINTQILLDKLSVLFRNIDVLRRRLREYSKLENDIVGNPIRLQEIVSKIEGSNYISVFKDAGDCLQDWLFGERSKLEDAQKQFQSKFGLNLERILEESGFELKGRYPRLMASFYTIKLDLESNKAALWYGPEEEFISIIPLNADRVATTLTVFHRKLTERPFDEDKFIRDVYQAYLTVLRKLSRHDGEKVPITNLMLEIAYAKQDRKFRTDPRRVNFRDYGRINFSYDLYRLKRKEIEGKIMTLAAATRLHVKDRERYLWIPVNEKGEGMVYSDIHFGG